MKKDRRQNHQKRDQQISEKDHPDHIICLNYVLNSSYNRKPKNKIKIK